MSELWVTNVYNQQGDGAPNFPNGATVTGVVTATTLKGDAEITGGTINAASVTAASGTFNGPVTIGGTLTYEDVTNIDSVGVITAREGIKVTGGGINAVGVITATSFVGSGANLTGIDALPSVSGTASGSITAGKAVMIKSDGNYEPVVGVDETLGAKSTGFSRTYYIKSTYDTASDKFVIVYADPANDYNPTSSVATISNTNAVSYGTKTSIQATNIGNNGLDVCYVANRSKVACVHRNGGSGIALERGTVSGTNITWDNRLAITNWNTAGSEKHRVIYNPDNNNILVLYKAGSGGSGTTHIAEFSMASNGTITALANKQMSNQTGESMDVCYDTENDGYVVVYVAGNQSSQPMIQFVQSGNGGAIPNATSETFITSGFGVNQVRCEYDPDTNQIIYLYQRSSDDNPYLMTIKCDGTSNFTYGTPLKVANLGAGIQNALGLTYMGGTAKKVIVTYQSSATSKVYVKSYIVNGTGFTEIPALEVDNSYGMYGAISCDTRGLITSKALVSFSDDNSNQDSYSKSYTPANSNLSADTYLGFANNTATNGQTVKVNTASNISTQSGLTTATKYYVGGSGGLISAPGNPSIVAGVALNSTQLLIKSA